MGTTPKWGEDDEYEDAPTDWRRRILVLVLVVAIVIGISYFELGYERGVVSRTVETGTITKVNNGATSVGAALPGQTASISTVASSSVVVSVNGITFTQTLPCGSPGVRVGQSVLVDNNVLRSGAHQYVANLACKGQPSLFVNVSTSASTTATSTSKSTSG